MVTTTTTDKNQLITDKLIALIEKGVKPWSKPWSKPWYSSPFQNLITNHVYRGINPILCQIDLVINNWEYPFFVTFQQAKELNWLIKKGSKATWIRWGGTYAKEIEDPNTKETKTEYKNSCRWFSIFNVACLDDSKSERKITEYLKPLTPPKPNNFNPISQVEIFINTLEIETVFGGPIACYIPALDTIRLPEHSNFISTEGFYSTYLHEIVHSSGHHSRCNRPLNNTKGSSDYAFEELIADLGSAFLCNYFGINYNLENHASYLDSWLSVLRGDKTAFIKATQKANQAFNYLVGETVNVEE